MSLRHNVWVLTLAQACCLSAPALVVLVGGLIGSALAPSPALVTLPVALIVVGTASSTVPMPLLMRRFGRKPVFIVVASFASMVALASAWFLAHANFWGFCLTVVCFGVGSGTMQQYRFAAMESVAPEAAGVAASRVLLGGLAAAVLGPQLSVWGAAIAPAHFAGAFVLLSGLYASAALVIAVGFTEPPRLRLAHSGGGRPWGEILRQPALWAAIASAAVGYAVMSFVMTATPLSMHVQMGHGLVVTTRVIQSHILAMYLPSLFSAWLLRRFGLRGLIYMGFCAYVGCILAGESGQGVGNYWLALVFLGVGWNFLFVGGTALLPRSYRPEERYRVQSLNEFLVFGSQALAALSSGWVIEHLSWYHFLLGILPLLALLGAVLWNWRRAERRARVAWAD